MGEKIVIQKVHIDKPENITLFFQNLTGLSKIKIKDAMIKGAVWITDRRKKRIRIRRATTLIQQSDHVEFYYDPDILSIVPPSAKLLCDMVHYSVWHKPVGLMTQGTDFGDHCSLIRQSEIYFQARRKSYPIHRLDRETEGLVVIAHTAEAAKKMSGLFQKREVIKRYRATVLGNLGFLDKIIKIEIPLDGKESITEYQAEGYDPVSNTSTVTIWIKTGRKHQIRRHFDIIGYPVMGDPQYGKGNKNDQGLQLRAISLEFRCPFLNKEKCFHLQGY
jgi:tRNA pseudouridine32 synthase / 23S rRNA pseudouridine746 synthase